MHGPTILCSESYAWIDAKFYHHGVTFCTQQSHHRMENRDVAAARKIGARHGIVKVQPTNATDECMSSTVLRDVLTLFQNGDLYLEGEYLLI
jgi:hypothetical protein